MTSWVDVARLRQGLYRFFGGALLPPDASRRESLIAAAGYLDGLGIEAFAFSGAWDVLVGTLECLPSSRELSAEYTRLFASGMDGELCPPTESFYTGSAEGGDLATAVAAVQRDYAVLGLSVVDASQPPDHATSELEAMAGLCSREVEDWESKQIEEVRVRLGVEHGFLRRHLAAWFPAFRLRVERSHKLPFYSATVDATAAFLVHEVDFIAWMRRVLEKNNEHSSLAV